jgi:hypothetical protein
MYITADMIIDLTEDLIEDLTGDLIIGIINIHIATDTEDVKIQYGGYSGLSFSSKK